MTSRVLGPVAQPPTLPSMYCHSRSACGNVDTPFTVPSAFKSIESESGRSFVERRHSNRGVGQLSSVSAFEQWPELVARWARQSDRHEMSLVDALAVVVLPTWVRTSPVTCSG